jgi:hypothetical protein
MTLLFSVSLSVTGLACLALAMERHHQRLFGKAAATWPRRGWRALGCCLLVGAFLICIRSSGWSIGLVEWVGLLTVAAICVVLGLTYCPLNTRVWLSRHLKKEHKV